MLKIEEDLLLAKKKVRELTAHLRRLDDSVTEKDAQIAEYLYHLERINASGWRRLGLLLDKLIRVPRILLGSLASKRQVTTPPTVPVSERIAPTPKSSIVLPANSANPEVSVVILSYGQVDQTLRCLNSIAEHPPLNSIEIIVSDDCSGAPDLGKLMKIANLTFIQSPTELGFLKHANWAVTRVRHQRL